MYLDIDAVSLGKIPDKISEKSKFPTNFGVAIFYGNVNNAVMKFQKGHPFLMEYMQLMVSSILKFLAILFLNLFKKIGINDCFHF